MAAGSPASHHQGRIGSGFREVLHSHDKRFIKTLSNNQEKAAIAMQQESGFML
ncbi:MAG: hypothetical protein KF804_15515 [Burkholderiales bacterium]|jgi:hypothetical protein|nr:hypothetical protein [Burkholderiales bacterium]